MTAGHKPDLALYNLQKEQALGLEPGTLTSQASTSKAMQRMKAMDGETLYADGNNLSFAEHKPSEEAVDQVIGQLNKESVVVTCCPRRFAPKLICVSLALAPRPGGPSRASAPTRTRVTLRTLTTPTRFSTRRSTVTTTSIRRRSGPTSSAARPFERRLHHLLVSSSIFCIRPFS